VLEKHELYVEVKPGLKSQCNLSEFFGYHGAESKLEKGHHIMHHLSNGGTRVTLADYTTLEGIALHN